VLPRRRTGGNELVGRSWAELVGGSRGRGGGSRAATAAAAAAAAADTAAIGVARKLAYRLSQEALGALGVAPVTQ
jgi:hypothetical protein